MSEEVGQVTVVEETEQIKIVNMIHKRIYIEFRMLERNPPPDTNISYAKEEGILSSLRYMVTVTPSSGTWKNGIFKFQVSIPRYYKPGKPSVMCINAEDVQHPNIGPNGEVGLRRIDDNGNWGMICEHTLRKLALDIRALFTTPIDPLNKVYNEEAGKMLEENPKPDGDNSGVTRLERPKRNRVVVVSTQPHNYSKKK